MKEKGLAFIHQAPGLISSTAIGGLKKKVSAFWVLSWKSNKGRVIVEQRVQCQRWA